MTYKHGDIIKLKEGVRPQMSLDMKTFFNLSDEYTCGHNDCRNDDSGKVKTYWGLPESAFETDGMEYVYLKSEYAKGLVWCVDDVTRIYDGFGGYEFYRLNINVAFDPEGTVSCGAFCSFVNDGDIVTKECDNINENLKNTE